MITFNVCEFFTVIKPVYSSWKLERAEEKRFSSSASGTEFNLSDISYVLYPPIVHRATQHVDVLRITSVCQR